MRVKSLGGGVMAIVAAQGNALAVHHEGGIPGDLDGGLDALVRGTALDVYG